MPVTFKCDVRHTEERAKNHGYGVWYPPHADTMMVEGGWHRGGCVLCPTCNTIENQNKKSAKE